jgi:HPt (histidine-containing phosphotransfer) domain-containing protein
MKTASIHEIKNELQTLELESLAALCMRLAKYKKENKELLTYLLFESNNEPSYIEMVKETIDELFTTVPAQNVYLIKKVLRKILRFVNKQVKYSGVKPTEVELRIYFCLKVKQACIPFTSNTVLLNMYQQQLNKINSALVKLPEDLQADYKKELEDIHYFQRLSR